MQAQTAARHSAACRKAAVSCRIFDEQEAALITDLQRRYGLSEEAAMDSAYVGLQRAPYRPSAYVEQHVRKLWRQHEEYTDEHEGAVLVTLRTLYGLSDPEAQRELRFGLARAQRPEDHTVAKDP